LDKKDFIRLGIVGKVHGISGQLSLVQQIDSFSTANNLQSVFIEIDSQLVPFFVQSFNRQNKKLLLRLDGINTAEQAELLKNSAVYIPASLVALRQDPESDFEQYIGFTVSDNTKGQIGILEEVLTLSGQKLLKILNPATVEILIPARKEFISHIDSANKKLVLNAPEGLIDIYLK
jgi:16S rRNA processing protein RimM